MCGPMWRRGDNASGIRYKGAMKAAAIAAVLALLHAAPAFAQTKAAAKPKADPVTKMDSTKAIKSCEEYGAGFVRMGETGTCVKIGGYLRMQGSAR